MGDPGLEALPGEDGTTISGTWESSPDGTSWGHDLDVV
jgi:hypothetical protein